MLEHPDITTIERKGYLHQPTKEIICTGCNRSLDEGELYGAFNGCVKCVDCLREKILNMSDIEIIELMEFKLERAEY